MRVVALAGGVGAGKFLRGLVRVVPPEDVTAVVNTGDDIEVHDLHVSPDLDSVSRLQSKLATPEESEFARRVREALALYRQSEDLINLGAYISGSNTRLDMDVAAPAW